MPDVILALNAGSSSFKLAAYALDGDALRGMLHGQATLGDAPRLRLDAVETKLPAGEDASFAAVLAAIRDRLGPSQLAAVGHRVVHGGERAGPARVTDALLEELAANTPLAPLHQGHNLAPIRALRRLQPDLPQVACFDTAFHRTMPAVATRFAIPAELHDAGVRRYGAHGLSYEFIAGTLSPALRNARVVVAHLGSGASLCALQAGRSIDTTMGLTPLDGLVMATRCGALDPGVVLYLMQARSMTAAAVEDLLYHRSGLLGVGGHADMRELTGEPGQDARTLFVHRLTQQIAAMAASLGGLDAIVFTGGIGEHDSGIRAAACDRLAFLGVAIDVEANRAGAAVFSTPASRVELRVTVTDEEIVIARHTRSLLEPA